VRAPRVDPVVEQAPLWEMSGQLGGSRPTQQPRPLLRSVSADPETQRDAGPRPQHDPAERVETPGLVLLLSVEEVARALRLGRSKTYELIASVELETVHIGRSVRVPVDAIERFVEGLRRPGATVALAARVTGRTVSSAATRRASLFVPRTVRLTCVGRPRSSRPVKALTSHTPGLRSRTVAMPPQRSRDGSRDMTDFRPSADVCRRLRISEYAGQR
jgi:excisionase family DNA binding protein